VAKTQKVRQDVACVVAVCVKDPEQSNLIRYTRRINAGLRYTDKEVIP
jgi:hypothetical protein